MVRYDPNITPYFKLRIAIMESGHTTGDIARAIGVQSDSVASTRLNAKSPWSIEEVYAVMDFIGRPYSDIPILFPPGERERFNRKKGSASEKMKSVP